MELVLRSILCFISGLFTAFYLKAPKKTIWYCATFAAVGGMISSFGNNGYTLFAAALTVGLLCETAARYICSPSTIFLSVAILPLAPGLDFFNMMRCLSMHQYSQALDLAVDIFTAAGAISLAIALSGLCFRLWITH